ncbi:MAG: Cof-type HAD-IIB family hydrolase [Lactobacillus sp.]|uniref:Cof-type HAD-IIB family hydrolase n=1 Tax=Lacticaseibacillus suilingensis TaxID=2799577 RepID=A0ABW4BE25_9LACO|nr:Cof-type HAD-IIB family hydrolase [Lacticaseibacillus suilingensis]MCI1893404.1 Cof-type HAD-IIB family hydrolase [Lactobacillus sp.]MCI1918452.1 Cof-type HAD-IIB family hydrolase [Lactobacillus sp.]MCI1940588.1 Cof-type HAD-IIB family hydrolase [Lactobacillus sp.]MCI1971007.1 Cof-type HAD-IIB family hydrolase [Lactobacillus sp.]MCI2016253.1 Cof-type HAD-IIB family hydrolase [Lactobacillus sp.]
MLQLVAVDMDGTFLRSDQDYDRARFARVHQMLNNHGVRFVVASGNQYYQLRSFFQDYPETIYVAENGAYIRDETQTYAVHTFTPAETAKITAILTSHPELKIVACGVKSGYVRASEGDAFITNTRRYYHRLAVQPTLEVTDDDILKFGMNFPPERTEEFLQVLGEELRGLAVATSSGHGDIDIIQPGRHKAAGLAELGQVLNIPLANMAAFGDGGNDLEMIKEVGLGVAMANAQPAVKQAADAQTVDNNAQGVLAFLEDYFKD